MKSNESYIQYRRLYFFFMFVFQIVRQFRRWNPEFFSFFLHVNGEWVPKLGRDGELRRRAEKRRLYLTAKQSQQQAQEGK